MSLFPASLNTAIRYGKETLTAIEGKAREQCGKLGFEFEGFQSNHEGAIVDRIHAARLDGTTAIIINAGAYTHTSVAIRDALSSIQAFFIEVHVSPPRLICGRTNLDQSDTFTDRLRRRHFQITNIHSREPFRHHSYLSDLANGVIVGLGTFGYTAAIWAVANRFKPQQSLEPSNFGK